MNLPEVVIPPATTIVAPPGDVPEVRTTDSSENSSHSGLRGRTLVGVAWSLVGRVGQQGIGFLISILLARLLSPLAFGQFAMIVVFSGFTAILLDSGLADAIVQRTDLEDDHISSVFLFSAFFGVAASLLFFLAAGEVARFYGMPDLESVAQVLSLNFAVSGLGAVPRALLRRRMQFRPLALIEIVVTLVSGTVAVGLSIIGAGTLSLAISSVIGTTVATTLLWLACPWRLHAKFRLTALRQIFGFSSGLLGFNCINYWARNLDNLLIGRILGASALGLYARAYYLMLLPITQITSVLSTAMFPALSSIQDDRPRVRSIFLRALGLIALVSAPLVAGMFVVADPLILALYGRPWVDVVPVLRILCLSSFLQALCNPVGWIYTSQGRTDWMFWWGLFASVMLIVAIAFGACLGSLSSIAYAYAIANAILFYPSIAIPGRLIGLSFSEVVCQVAGSVACAILMAAFVHFIGMIIHGRPPWVMLAIQVPFGMLSYLLIVRVARLSAYGDLMGFWRRQGGFHACPK